jgi:hypothetical protein
LIETAPAPRTTVQSPLRWNASPDWKLDYCNVERLTAEEIRVRRSDFDQGRIEARNVRESAGVAGSDATGEMAG